MRYFDFYGSVSGPIRLIIHQVRLAFPSWDRWQHREQVGVYAKGFAQRAEI
ncbi:MAG: hypothetical protein M3N43_14750 [Actinomycetota bacterium]|nr:hypothetical protein [Actinomycetota bacterium]